MSYITTESQIDYLFARIAELEALVRHYERKVERDAAHISTLQDRCDVLADAIVDALHGKTLDETYEQAFDRVMARLMQTEAQ